MDNSPKEVIVCSNLKKSFGNFEALKGVSVSLHHGEFLTLFGPNGAGKSTFLKIAAGIIPPTSGMVKVFGVDLYSSESNRLKQQIGFISHNTFLYNNLTAYENLEFYGQLYQVENLHERIIEVLKDVELEKRMHTVAGTFSRGMQQRLAIARAILHKPSLIFLDEPYTGLDQHASMNLKHLLTKLHHEDTTIIMTTHNIEIGFESCTQLAILYYGNIIFQEKSEDLTFEIFKERYFELVQ